MAASFPIQLLPDNTMEKQAYEDSMSDSSLDVLNILVDELRQSLEKPNVLTPDSEGYAESIKRWSDGVEKRAVSNYQNRNARDEIQC